MLSSLEKFLSLVWNQRRLIFTMAGREIKSQYVGSALGFFWTVVQPIVMISVFWFVFSVGFKARPMSDVPFVVWLTAGLAPWYFFSDILHGSTGIIVEHAHLVKKTIFYPQILPIIKIVSGLVRHFIFIGVLIVLIFFQKMPLLFTFTQFFYYTFCLIVLALGAGWFCSALNVFLRDINQLVGVALQVGFWLTPIFWDINMMPESVRVVLQLNPLYYIVQGYRDSFIGAVPFWHHPVYTIYFWIITGAVFITGALVFRRLKPQFSDVL
ncbi:MAG: ABC transporter permease [Bacteroidetes bacterium]|nr:ABC transporter permease [Bacteroidota bacterium]